MTPEIQGLQQKQDGRPRPSVGPKDFEWPTHASKETRKKFAAALNELMTAKGMSYSDLATVCWGRQAVPEGEYRPPRNASLLRSWSAAKAFPIERQAGFIAQALGVPMSRLLEPEGEYKPLEPTRSNGHGKSNGNGNGLAIEPHEPSPPPLQLPEGATPAIVQMSTHKTDPRFVEVSVTGTLPVDVALSLFALIHPRPQ